MTDCYDIHIGCRHRTILCEACNGELGRITDELRSRHIDRYLNIKVPKSHLVRRPV